MTPTSNRRLAGAFALVCFCVLAWSSSAFAEQITLNVKNTDIRSLIDTVSEATGKNFIVDPRVSGKVTVVSSTPMGRDKLYQVFLQVLQVHGYSAIESEGVVKIVPDASAKQDATPVVTNDDDFEGGQLVTRVIQLNHVPVAQLEQILRPLVPQQGQLATHGPSNTLVVSDRAANVERLVNIVRRIDRPLDNEIEVIKLHNASASELASIVRQLNQNKGAGDVGFNKADAVADERTNSLIVTGARESRVRIRGLVAALDAESDSADGAHVINLKHARAVDLAALLADFAEDFGAVDGVGDAKKKANTRVKIKADETTNALLVMAQPGAMERIKKFVRKLDVPRSQVVVRAIVAEVSKDLSAELGVQMVVDGARGGVGPIGISSFGPGATNLSTVGEALSAGTIPSVTGALLGIGNISGSRRYALLLRALQGDAATNILSTPNIITMDNSEAEIVVGQNVPFLTGSFTGSNAATASNPFQTIERQDIGIKLKVRPQINEGNAIKLDIEQEVSSVAASSTGAADLITNKRTLKTSVMVEDGQVIALGGLVDESFQDSAQQVPLLGDLPLVGSLFRYSNSQKVKRDLTVFINPTIVRAPSLLDRASRDRYRYLQQLQRQMVPEQRGALNGPQSRFPPMEKILADRVYQQPPQPHVQGDTAAVKPPSDDRFSEDDIWGLQ